MTRREIVETIQQHWAELQGLGVKTLSLFGSAARDEAGPGSDVDVLIEFEGPARFDAFMAVKELLEGVLRRRVDLVTVGALRPLVRSRIQKDLVHVA